MRSGADWGVSEGAVEETLREVQSNGSLPSCSVLKHDSWLSFVRVG